MPRPVEILARGSPDSPQGFQQLSFPERPLISMRRHGGVNSLSTPGFLLQTDAPVVISLRITTDFRSDTRIFSRREGKKGYSSLTMGDKRPEVI